MRHTLTFVILIIAALLVACTPMAPQDATTATPTGDATVVETPISEPTAPPVVPAETSPAEEKAALYTIEGTEGDLIQLKPEAVDPDGDKITFSFTKPFDTVGRWQTNVGDEGLYNVVVGASDGKLTTTESVKVVVHRANRPPVVDCKPVSVSEGETIDLHDRCTITDEDDSEIIVTYGGWMGSWRYTTTYEDAGTHTVTLTASDKRKGAVLHTVTKDVLVTVKNMNRPPVFAEKFPAQISGTENDIITLPKNLITDPDGDKMVITYSAPFGPDGTWKTKIGDAGSYDVDVVASDGVTTMKRTVKVKISMLNTAPVLKTISDVTVKEGETIKLPISAIDREGDKLITTISGWMTGDTYKTTYDDAGSYTVKVTVTDGVFNTTQVVKVTVIDQNRPPVFVVPA